MAVNDKAIEVRNKVFGGNIGAEAKMQNEAIMAILLRQDAIVAAMTPTAKAAYDEATAEHRAFLDSVRAGAFEFYGKVQSIRS